MRYQTYVFDLDGTLLDTLGDLAASTNYALRTHGMPEHSLDDVRRFVGNGVRRLMMLAHPGGEAAPDFEEVLNDFKTWYADHSGDKTKPYAGILETLGALKKRGVKMAIVSNKFDAAVKQLNELYFEDLIPVAIGENEAAGVRKKPAPDSVYRAMELLGAVPGQTLYIGDSEVDHETSRQAGLDLVLVSWGFRPREALEKYAPAALIDRPEDILKFS